MLTDACRSGVEIKVGNTADRGRIISTVFTNTPFTESATWPFHLEISTRSPWRPSSATRSTLKLSIAKERVKSRL